VCRSFEVVKLLLNESLSEVSIDLGGIVSEVSHTVGVTPLVVVPRNELDEARAETDTGISIKDRGKRGGEEVR